MSAGQLLRMAGQYFADAVAAPILRGCHRKEKPVFSSEGAKITKQSATKKQNTLNNTYHKTNDVPHHKTNTAIHVV